MIFAEISRTSVKMRENPNVCPIVYSFEYGNAWSSLEKGKKGRFLSYKETKLTSFCLEQGQDFVDSAESPYPNSFRVPPPPPPPNMSPACTRVGNTRRMVWVLCPLCYRENSDTIQGIGKATTLMCRGNIFC